MTRLENYREKMLVVTFRRAQSQFKKHPFKK